MMLFSCSEERSQEILSESERKEITKEVHTILSDYYNDIRASGLMAEFKYLDNSKEFFWVPPGFTSPISYDSVESIIKRNAPLLKSVENSFDTLMIIPLSKSLASYSGRLQSVVIDTAGNQSKTTMMETGVLIKRGDGWKLLSGQTSLINP